MKKTYKILLLITLSVCQIGCKKDQFDSIKRSTDGKWKLEFVKGGFIGNYFRDFHNENFIWNFYSGNRLTINYNGSILTDTTIAWSRDTGPGTGPDPVYIMKFYDKQMVPWVYFVQGINNDSLFLHDYGDDGQSWHFSKSN